MGEKIYKNMMEMQHKVGKVKEYLLKVRAPSSSGCLVRSVDMFC
jgi:hypothetical protein